MRSVLLIISVTLLSTLSSAAVAVPASDEANEVEDGTHSVGEATAHPTADGDVLLEARDQQIPDWVLEAGGPSSADTQSPTTQAPRVPRVRCGDGIVAGSHADPTPAGHYRPRCGGADEIHSFAPVPDSDDPDDADDTPDLLALVDEAIDQLQPAAPTIITSPPSDPGAVTGLPTYLAVDPDTGPSEATVTAGDWTATATIEPLHLVISPGDQTEPFICDGHGTIWTQGDRPGADDCTHTYIDLPDNGNIATGAGTVPLQIHVVYRAVGTIIGPDGSITEDLGTFGGPATTIDLPVREHRAVRTG